MSQAFSHIRIGYISKTHGVRGEVLVKPLTDDPKRFELLNQVFIENQGEHEIEYVRFHRDRLILKLKGFNSANDSLALKGKYIAISKKDLVKLPEGSYFVFDILGCEVRNLSGDVLGIVTDVLQTGGNDVYAVSPATEVNVIKYANLAKDANRAKGTDILIPAVKSVIKEISINDKLIIVDYIFDSY